LAHRRVALLSLPGRLYWSRKTDRDTEWNSYRGTLGNFLERTR